MSHEQIVPGFSNDGKVMEEGSEKLEEGEEENAGD